MSCSDAVSHLAEMGVQASLGYCQERCLPYCHSGGHYQRSPSDGVLWRWRIDQDHLRLMTTAGGSIPAARMTLTLMVVDADTVSADRNSFSAVALGWRHEPDVAVAVFIISPAARCQLDG
jgi:hypothetical protein